jgi:LysR family cyn operon transcriptional activator
VDIESLSGVAVLLLNEGYLSRQAFDSACRLAHVNPHVVLESGAPQTILALAEAGLGVAIIPSTVSLKDRDLKVVPATHRGAVLEIPASVC